LQHIIVDIHRTGRIYHHLRIRSHTIQREHNACVVQKRYLYRECEVNLFAFVVTVLINEKGVL
jgi:hypothetical protein